MNNKYIELYIEYIRATTNTITIKGISNFILCNSNKNTLKFLISNIIDENQLFLPFIQSNPILFMYDTYESHDY